MVLMGKVHSKSADQSVRNKNKKKKTRNKKWDADRMAQSTIESNRATVELFLTDLQTKQGTFVWFLSTI